MLISQDIDELEKILEGVISQSEKIGLTMYLSITKIIINSGE